MTTKELMTFIGGLVSILGANEALSIHLAPRSIAPTVLEERAPRDQCFPLPIADVLENAVAHQNEDVGGIVVPAKTIHLTQDAKPREEDSYPTRHSQKENEQGRLDDPESDRQRDEHVSDSLDEGA